MSGKFSGQDLQISEKLEVPIEVETFELDKKAAAGLGKARRQPALLRRPAPPERCGCKVDQTSAARRQQYCCRTAEPPRARGFSVPSRLASLWRSSSAPTPRL